MAKLSEICDIKAGGTPSRAKQEYWNGNISWVKISDFNGKYVDVTSEKITEEGLNNSSAKMIEKGSILYTIFATLGEVAILNIDATTNQAIAALTPDKSQVDTDYLYYFLFSLKDYVNEIGRGVAQNNINMSILKNIEIPLPPLEPQKQIAANLDKVTHTIDLCNAILEKLDLLVKSRFVEMFGDPETNPKEWKKEELKKHADVLVGYPFSSEDYTTEGIKIVGGYNLMQGFIQWSISKCWSDTIGFEQYLLQENDIVMAMDRPWVNGGFKIARIDSEHLPALLIQRTACIRSQKEMEQAFLFYMLDTERFASHCNITGSLVPHISNKDINNFKIIIPPLELQQQFAAFVEQTDKSKLAVKQVLEKAETLKKALMQRYFG